MVPQWEEASWPLVESRTAILPGILSSVRWLFHKAAGFPRNPSCPYKQRLQHRCEKALQQYWSGEKGRVQYSVDKGLRYTH